LVLRSHQTKTRTSFVTHGQAVGFARAGLTDAVGWLRKQTAQPVTAFDPVLDNLASPPVLDTSEPEVGIAREFKITGAVWGRYEVWKDWPTDPDPTRLAWRNQMRVLDVSAARAGLTPGSIWKLRSIGYVFRKVDDTLRFDEYPNQVIGQEILEIEARRLALSAPSTAALCIRTASRCSVLTNGTVQGLTTGCGIFSQTGTGAPTISGVGALVNGVPPRATAAVYKDTYYDVFGVTLPELKPMADYVTSDINDFPNDVPTGKLVIFDGNLTLDASRTLRGTGVLVVNGNLTIQQNNQAAFNGMIYVAGNFVLREPAEINGTVIVTGSATIQGGSDLANVIYDGRILQYLRQLIGSYRTSSTISRPLARDH
ncbi:MAG TPA: hypothetical protein VK348_11660, partial [Planctomycetota bacterium]|nr:hypothetical protein [Planctomycetota bacterium]